MDRRGAVRHSYHYFDNVIVLARWPYTVAANSREHGHGFGSERVRLLGPAGRHFLGAIIAVLHLEPRRPAPHHSRLNR